MRWLWHRLTIYGNRVRLFAGIVGRYAAGPSRDESWSWWRQQRARLDPVTAWREASLVWDVREGERWRLS